MVIRREYKMDPVVRYVHSLNEELFLLTEVAYILGKGRSTLTRLHRDHPELNLGPSHEFSYGRRTYNLYTAERVAQLREYFATPRLCKDGTRSGQRGARVMFSPEEARERSLRGKRAHFRIAQGKRAQAAGLHELAAAYFEEAEAMMEVLAAEHAARFAIVHRPRQRPE